MTTANHVNITLLPVREKSKREAALGRDIDSLIDTFRELRKIEAMTGRAGLSTRVRLCVADVLASADRIAQEEMSPHQSRAKTRERMDAK